MSDRHRAGRNRTVTVGVPEMERYRSRLLRVDQPIEVPDLLDKTICQDMLEVLPNLPSRFVDLLFVDSPYNLDKQFNDTRFRQKASDDYADWVDRWLSQLVRLLKPTASVYICSDWRSSSAVHSLAQKYFKVRNRITWEREKGRGALRNWKNCSEDIWFCTMSDEYHFDLDAVNFYPREIGKINERILHFQKVRNDWESRSE